MAHLPLLARDTAGDKAVRFCLGAVLGVIAGWSFSLYGNSPETGRGLIALLAMFAVVTGIVAVLGGNRAIEWLIKHGSS